MYCCYFAAVYLLQLTKSLHCPCSPTPQKKRRVRYGSLPLAKWHWWRVCFTYWYLYFHEYNEWRKRFKKLPLRGKESNDTGNFPSVPVVAQTKQYGTHLMITCINSTEKWIQKYFKEKYFGFAYQCSKFHHPVTNTMWNKVLLFKARQHIQCSYLMAAQLYQYETSKRNLHPRTSCSLLVATALQKLYAVILTV